MNSSRSGGIDKHEIARGDASRRFRLSNYGLRDTRQTHHQSH